MPKQQKRSKNSRPKVRTIKIDFNRNTGVYVVHHVAKIDLHQDTHTNHDEIVGMLPVLHRKLFGKRLNEDLLAKPWQRGLIKISVGKYHLYRIFRGDSSKGMNGDTVTLSVNSANQLSLGKELGMPVGQSKPRQRVLIHIERAPCIMGRFMFYWEHPDNQTRISFKAGYYFFAAGIVAGICIEIVKKFILHW